MSADNKRTDEKEQSGLEFVVEPLSDDEIEDVSGGNAPDGCVGGSGCCDGSDQFSNS